MPIQRTNTVTEVLEITAILTYTAKEEFPLNISFSKG